MVLYIFYGICVACAAIMSAVLLHRYAAPKRVSFLVLLISWYGWLTSFSVVALVPLDVYTTLSGEGNDTVVLYLWRVSYWSTQLLTWLAIPVLQHYSLSGAPSVLGRFGYALNRMWKFYAIVGVLAVLGVLVAAAFGKLELATLPQLIVTFSNTYGLVAIMALLGYGMVEVPKVLWRRSFPESRLKWHLHRVGKSCDRLEKASKELEQCLIIVVITMQQIPRSETELREQAISLMNFANRASPIPLKALQSSKIDVESLEERDLDYAGDGEGVASLRERLKRAIAEFVGSRGDYIAYLKKAIELEALCKSRQIGVYQPMTIENGGWLGEVGWHYKCRIRPYVQRLGAFICAAASALVVWCEATIASGRHPDLSPFSILIHEQSLKYSQWLIQFSVAAPLGYVCVCTFFSLFKLGSLGPYHMVQRATWSWSLLLNASLLSRFAAPLCFNYLHVIRMTGKQRGGRTMVFVDSMGMEDVPLLGARFNVWFPLVMVVYVAILTTGIFEQCFTKVFVPRKLRFDSENADDEHSSKGQGLLAVEHENLNRGGSLGEGCNVFGMQSDLEDNSTDAELEKMTNGKYWNRRTLSVELGTSKYSSTQRLNTSRYDSSLVNKSEEDEEDAIRDEADALFSGLGRS